MKALWAMTRRNTRLFFKDKGMFFTSLITPGILLLLYTTFLGKVYRDSFRVSLPPGFTVSDSIINGCVAAQLMSSLLAVSAVTVAFCSNMLMVQDKANGTIRDFTITPVRPSVLSMSYYLSTFLTSFLVCLAAYALCLIYVAVVGFYMTAADLLLILLDTCLLTLFGTALSSLVSFFLSTQGQMSAVGTIVSAGYGFICGAYMPISQFSDGLQKVISFLPGTYGTALLRNHAMRGAFEALKDEGAMEEYVQRTMESVDCYLYFFGKKVPEYAMYLVLVGAVAVLILLYVLMNILKSSVREKNR